MSPGQRLRLADRLAWVAVILTAIASVAGLAVPGLYGDRDALVRLTQADEVFRLAIVLPILAIGLATAARGSITGRLAALGALATLAYLYAFLAFGAALNAATLAHITILGLVFWSLLLVSTAMDPRAVERVVTRRLLRRTTAVFLVAIAGLSVLQWSATILGAVASGTLPADVEPSFVDEDVRLVALDVQGELGKELRPGRAAHRRCRPLDDGANRFIRAFGLRDLEEVAVSARDIDGRHLPYASRLGDGSPTNLRPADAEGKESPSAGTPVQLALERLVLSLDPLPRSAERTECNHGLLVGHARAVVLDLNGLDPSQFVAIHRHLNDCGVSVQRVPDEFGQGPARSRPEAIKEVAGNIDVVTGHTSQYRSHRQRPVRCLLSQTSASCQ